MNAIRVERPGGPEVLRPTRIEKPVPSAEEVLIRLRATGVNFADLMCRAGTYPGRPAPPPIPGCEGSGEIEAVGAAVTRYRIGDRVGVYSPRGGSYAEWMTAPEHHVLPLPPVMSFEDAAAFLHVFLTAYHAMNTLGHVRAGELAVVTAAAGGVGTAILQLARAWGVRVVAGVGSASKLALVQRFGPAYRVDYRATSLAAFVNGVTAGHGADLVLDSVGGALIREAMQAVAPLARVVSFGVASGDRSALDPLVLHRTSSSFAMLNMSVLFARRQDLIDVSWRELVRLYEDGAIRPVVTHRFPLDQAAEAHRLIESRATVGKLLLMPDGDVS